MLKYYGDIARDYLLSIKDKNYASAVQEVEQYRDAVNTIVNQYKDISYNDILYR